MHVVTLSPNARSHLAGQLAYSLRTGQGFMCAYPLVTADKVVSDIAMLMINPHASDITVLVKLFGSHITTTLPAQRLSPEHVGELLADLANMAQDRFNYPSELQVCSDLPHALRLAIRLREGIFLLPTNESLELYLVLERRPLNCDRASFRFVLDGVSNTMSALLPSSEETALRLLLAVAGDIISGSKG